MTSSSIVYENNANERQKLRRISEDKPRGQNALIHVRIVSSVF